MSVRFFGKPAAIVAASVLLSGFVVSAAQAEDAKALYDKQCLSCHGATGKGDGPAAKALKPPAKDFATVLKGKSDADTFKATKEGGKAVGLGASMPGYGKKLTDDQINALVKYMKELASK